MTLINLTNRSYNINLKREFADSHTLFVLPWSAADYPDHIADEPEVKAKADKEIFRIVMDPGADKSAKKTPLAEGGKQSLFSKIKVK